jgi:methenyltetrahydrofolate cyclohydrolase
LLDAVAARTPAPGGGSSAAGTCALAAALAEMAARFAGDWALAHRARELRERALNLAEIELTAYEPVLEALRLPREDPDRAARLAAARTDASQSPLEVAQLGAEVAELAADIAQAGNPNLAGDAIAGALLAEAAAQASARLVEINLTDGPMVDQAALFAGQARESRDRALGPG